jgi:hypothetical protein
VSLPALAVSPLNDTGIDFCRDHATGNDTTVTPSTTCSAAQGGQDARTGRDPAAARSAIAKTGGGSKGFDFSKIANDGSPLPAGAGFGSNPGDWACTYDNTSGLLWEVKVDDVNHLRHKDWTYSWYDSDGSHTYAGGYENLGTCLTAGRCDTEKFVADVIAAKLCNHADWRMPTVDELSNLADLSLSNSGSPTIDATYFPNTPAKWFWSGSPVAGDPDGAWDVDFDDGGDYWDGRNCTIQVRLVRAGQ